MNRKVLVIGHSDADGHVIAEQTRRNLASIPSFDVQVVVDPKRTYGHGSWMHLDQIPEIGEADYVFFVDLMFSPATFIGEARGLAATAAENPRTTFFVVDHHPLPLGRLSGSPNLRVLYRPDVFECVIGPKSGLMILAAIFERQGETIADIRKPLHRVLEKGLRRAAAPGGPLAGEALMTLLQYDRWDLIHAIAEEDSAVHQIVRGRRIQNQPMSETLKRAETLANDLGKKLKNDDMREHDEGQRIDTMVYNVAAERYARTGTEPHRYRNEPVPTKDLEALVTLLEVAALSLTHGPDTTFSRDELLREARDIGGEGLEIDERDVRIVLEKAAFVEWSGGELRLR